MELIRTFFTKRFALRLAAWVVAAIAVLGVTASCENESGKGMHQGGSDSVPHWR